MRYRSVLPAAVAVGVIGGVCAASAQQPIAIATPPSGSIYNSSAAAIGKVLADKAGLRMTLQAMGGSSQYLPIVNAGEVPFGIANVYETNLGVTGTDYFKGRPTKDIRTVAILFPLRNTIFVKKDSDIKKLSDLKGKRGPIGFTSQKVLTAVTNAALAPGGITLDDVKGVNVANIIANVNAFKEGRTDFFVFRSARPMRRSAACVRW
jgi:TRAP transporter TAXI family solute receptor